IGRDLGSKPLLVLTGTRDADAEWQSMWVDGLQADLVHLSSNATQVLVPNSGHGIQFDAPDAVVDAIQRVWAETKR
ncbi:MAG: alpha/beta fold hydrolase, partial [Bryobacteraceae bacterium]